MKRIPVIILTMFASPIFSQGQKGGELPGINLHLKIEDSITSNVPKVTARIITQDRNGNIWIAAFDGVFKYDGQSFVNVAGHLTSSRFFFCFGG